jgi:hypothetical protein
MKSKNPTNQVKSFIIFPLKKNNCYSEQLFTTSIPFHFFVTRLVKFVEKIEADQKSEGDQQNRRPEYSSLMKLVRPHQKDLQKQNSPYRNAQHFHDFLSSL